MNIMKDRETHILDQDISIHICTISAGLVGVCLTTIGLIRVVISIRKIDTFADDLLSVDALIFLFATIASYWSLRTRSIQRHHTLERLADTAFIAGVSLMAICCVFICFAISAV